METYKLFTKDPIKKIEEIILHKAMPFALKEITNDLSRNNLYIQRQKLLHALPLLASNGLQIMRSKRDNRDSHLFSSKIGELFKMDYSAVSQAAKRFE